MPDIVLCAPLIYREPMLCIRRFSRAPFKTEAEKVSAIFINYSLPVYCFYLDSFFASLVCPILLKRVKSAHRVQKQDLHLQH